MHEPDGETPFAYYPLTHFDFMLRGSGITLGWLVESIIDEAKLERVLQSLVAKWPLLGGRLQCVTDEQVCGSRLREFNFLTFATSPL